MVEFPPPAYLVFGKVTLLEQMSASPIFSGISSAQSLVFCIVVSHP